MTTTHSRSTAWSLRTSTSKSLLEHPSWSQITLPYALSNTSSHCPAAPPTHMDQHRHHWTDTLLDVLSCYEPHPPPRQSGRANLLKWRYLKTYVALMLHSHSNHALMRQSANTQKNWCMATTNTHRQHRGQDLHRQPHRYCTPTSQSICPLCNGYAGFRDRTKRTMSRVRMSARRKHSSEACRRYLLLGKHHHRTPAKLQ